MTKKEKETIFSKIAEYAKPAGYYYGRGMKDDANEMFQRLRVVKDVADALGFSREEITETANAWTKIGERQGKAELAAERGKHRAERELKSLAETLYLDRETGKTISRAELEQEFQTLKSDDPESYNYTFSEYLHDCLGKNGSLMEV